MTNERRRDSPRAREGLGRAAELSIGAGVVLLVWLAIEMLIIPLSWLQPMLLIVALAVIMLGFRARATRG